MSSKKYRNKLCVYCGSRPSTTGDHVFAREFFAQTRRANLPQVPACDRCNRAKSELEHYLTAVLPFGGEHEDAHNNLVEQVPRRLAKNAKLHHALHAGRSHIWHAEGKVVRWDMTVPIEADKITALGRYVAQGLAWYHWNVRLSHDETAEAWLLSSFGRALFDRLFAMNAALRVREDLGRGSVRYAGVKSNDESPFTLWRIQFYGGLQMAGDAERPHEVAGEVGAFTGPKRLLRVMAGSV